MATFQPYDGTYAQLVQLAAESLQAKQLVIVQIERADTAKKCMQDFFNTIGHLDTRSGKEGKDGRPHMVEVEAVGIRLGGAGTQADLIWLPHRPEYIYAHDRKTERMYRCPYDPRAALVVR